MCSYVVDTGLPWSGKDIWKWNFYSRSGKSQGILWMAREKFREDLENQGKSRDI